MPPPISVGEFYAGKTIFLTGATGFMGKVLVEKFLRSCPDVKKIYMLMRPKKGQGPKERLDDFIHCKVFERLQKENPKSFEKLRVVPGDILVEDLGISSEDREELQRENQILFHCAACVRFDMPLRDAVYMNTVGTQRVMDLALGMKKLEVFVHVSTSYCRCEVEVLEEKLYPSKHRPQHVIDCVKWMDDELITHMQPKIIDPQPNTYAYTKSLTEDLVSQHAGKFPIAIARPSIVIASYKEPMPGWVDNFNGPTGLLVGAGKGVIRTMHCNEKFEADVVPVDMVVNGCILVAYATALDKSDDVQVYNITQSGINPLSWGDALEIGRGHLPEFPFSVCLWYPGGSPKTSKLQHQIAVFFTHLLPAYFVDLLLFLTGNKTFMIKMQKRINYGLEVLQYYTTKEWHFRNERFLSLRKRISEEDDKIFFTDIKLFNWYDYMRNYIKGTREYCCKEDPSTLPQARKLHKQMPRKYKPDPRSKRHLTYNKEVIHEALKDMNDNKLSYREAAKKHDIHYSVLYRHATKIMKKLGGQTVLTESEEECLVEHINICAEWGQPFDLYDLRILVKQYLDKKGVTCRRFKNNMPGREFALSFMNRHKTKISQRYAQNIKRYRAAVNEETINDYFENMKEVLEDVPCSNIINYDETNLCDDPGKKKVITKRGCKYPERIVNHTKASTSIMVAGTAAGDMLPVYVVYKASHLYDSWTDGGPKGTRYNRTKSGWFDTNCFEDWINTVLIPYCKNLDGKKVVVGDNLSTHFSIDCIKKCKDYNIHFVFFPANSTHLTQPLDVAFFRPLKMTWRDILSNWKKGPGRKEASIPKSMFPRLLCKLVTQMYTKTSENLKSGFRKTGIYPFEPKQVIDRLPKENRLGTDNQDLDVSSKVSDAVVDILKSYRYGDSEEEPNKKKKRINIAPGKSLCNLLSPVKEKPNLDTEMKDLMPTIENQASVELASKCRNLDLIELYQEVPFQPKIEKKKSFITKTEKQELKSQKIIVSAEIHRNKTNKKEIKKEATQLKRKKEMKTQFKPAHIRDTEMEDLTPSIKNQASVKVVSDCINLDLIESYQEVPFEPKTEKKSFITKTEKQESKSTKIIVSAEVHNNKTNKKETEKEEMQLKKKREIKPQVNPDQYKFCKVCHNKKIFAPKKWMRCKACQERICEICCEGALAVEFICDRCLNDSDDSVADEDFNPLLTV